MKRIVSILLSVVLVMTMLAGCAGKKAGVEGKWTAEMDFAEALNSGAEGVIYKDIVCIIETEFKSDGTYACDVNDDSWEDAVKKVEDQTIEWMDEYLSTSLEETGVEMSLEEAYEMAGLSQDAVREEIRNEFKTLADEMEIEGKYIVKDNKIYTSESVDAEVDEIDEDAQEDFVIDGEVLKLEVENGPVLEFKKR